MIRLFQATRWVLALTAGTSLFCMMVLTFVDVIGRYGFNQSIFGTAEMIEYLMVVVVFAGVAFVSSADEHIKIEIFEAPIKRAIPNLQRWSVLLFSLSVYAFLTWNLVGHAFATFHSGKETAVLALPVWILTAAAALFSIVGVSLFALAIVLTRGHPSDLSQDFGSTSNQEPSGE